jgi:8-oxo-dGTP pyrophosphatase MutT (NUDIX family)
VKDKSREDDECKEEGVQKGSVRIKFEFEGKSYTGTMLRWGESDQALMDVQLDTDLPSKVDGKTFKAGTVVRIGKRNYTKLESVEEAKIAPIDRDEMVRRIEMFLKREWESIPAEAIRKFREAHPRHVYFTKLPQDATPAQLWPEMDIHTHVMKSSKGDHIIVKHPFVKDYAPDFEKHWREWIKAQGWAVQSYDDYNIFVEPNYGSESASVGPALWHFTFPDKVAGIKSGGLKPSGSKTWGDSLSYEPKVFAFTTYNAALKARKEMYFFATRPVSLIQILPNKLRPGTKWFKDVHVDGGVWTYTHIPAEAISSSVENLPALRAPDKVEDIDPVSAKELEDPLTDKGKLKFKHAIAIVVKDGNSVLLGISTHDDDRKGKLVFPGGHVEKNGDESGDVQQAAAREAEEEAGIKCDPTGTVVVDDERPKHAFVVCKYRSGSLVSNWEFEKDSLRWIPFEDIEKTDNILDLNRKVLKRVPNGQLGEK